MENVKVTTIIPMYNAEGTIISALNSVSNQLYQGEIEVIIINDGSSDNSEMVVKQYIELNQAGNISFQLISQKNNGVSSARNVGINNSSGEYIAFLDSDDMWHPQKIELLMIELKLNEIDVLGHAYTLNDNFKDSFKKNILLSKISFFSLLAKNFATTPSVIVKRSAIELFNENMKYTEDHDLWLRISLKHKVFFLNVPLVRLGRPQLSVGGLSSNKWGMRKGELKMLLNISKRKKILILLLPFLFLFSLSKHLKQCLKGNRLSK